MIPNWRGATEDEKMTEPFKKVMVMGAGGMGALFGAILAEGGFDVVLVDNDREHVDAIRKDGSAYFRPRW